MRLLRTTSGLLTAVLLTVAHPATAHFVWLERTAEGAVQACFGEYPTGRESGELLDKIARVKAAAVTADGVREAATKRGEHGFVLEHAPDAPVYAADLQYGEIKRGEADPYDLRYEAVLLTGDGPQDLGTLAQRSRLETGLSLKATLQPAGNGAVTLTASKAGEPCRAYVTWRQPGEVQSTTVRADRDGTLTLPVRPGTNYLRILDEDKSAAKVAKTYLLLTFDATLDTEADCTRLLAEAHEARAHWPEGFKGFTADAQVSCDGAESTGTITVHGDGKIDYDLDHREARAAIQPALLQLVMHRFGGGSGPSYNATWRDAQPHPMGRAIALHDRFDSVYRIGDQQILQVQRLLDEGRFVTNVLANEKTKLGYLPRTWTVTYYDDDGRISKNSTTDVTWSWIGDIFVPATVRRAETTVEGSSVIYLTLTNAKLLD